VDAASATWNGGSDALWATPGNWSASPVPAINDTATFNNAGGAVDIVSLAGVTVHTIRFDTSAAAYTLGSGAVNSQTLTLNNDGAITLNSATANNQLFNAAILLGTDGSTRTFGFTNSTAAKTLTLAGSIAGSAGAGIKTLALAGSGPVIFNGAISNGTTGSVKTDQERRRHLGTCPPRPPPSAEEPSSTPLPERSRRNRRMAPMPRVWEAVRSPWARTPRSICSA
jgi:hypothetical protein